MPPLTLACIVRVVDAAAKKFAEKLDADKLGEVSKRHFRTAFRAQGLLKPPKTEWRRSK